MKKFLLTLLKFIAFAIPLYIIILFLWTLIFPQFMAKNVRSSIAAYGHLFSRVQDVKSVKNPDILFLGSSHTYRGFDTRIFTKYGYKTFNLGSSSQSPINTQVLMKQYLDEIKPKFVVYEICGETLETDGVESSLDMLSNNKIDGNVTEMVFKLNNLKTYNTLIYNFIRQKLNLNDNIIEPKNQDGNFYIKGGGFVESFYRKNPLEEEKIRTWNVIDYQEEKLKENIEILKKKNIPFLLVQTPITEKMYKARTNNKEVEDMIANLGPYKNFQGVLKLNDTLDFYDSNHLNQEAVVKFNEIFIAFYKSLKK